MIGRKRLLRVILLLTVCLLGIGAFTWLGTFSAGPVRAETDPSTVVAPAEIQASQIFTDAYEPNDSSPGFNLGSSFGAGTSCSVPGVIVENASLYPVTGTVDVDYYDFSVAGRVVYTISVVPTTISPTTPIKFIVVIRNQSYSQVASAISNTPTISFFAPATGGSPDGGTFHIFVQAQNPAFDPRDQAYNISLCSSPTALPPIPTPIATPYGAGPDPFEPNDTPLQVLSRPGGIASYINIGSQIANSNFYPYDTSIVPVTVTGAAGDIDWYFFYGKKSLVLGGTGGCYRIATAVQPGVDTDITIYADMPTVPLAHNDDVAPLNRSSLLSFAVLNDARYWIKVVNLDSSPRGYGQTYNISVVEVSPNQIGCALLYFPHAYLPVQMAGSAFNGTATAVPTLVPVATPTSSPNSLGPVIVTGSVAITNVNAAAGTAFDEYLDIFNVGNSPVTLVDWKIRVGGQVYNLSNPPGTQLQLLQQQGCRVYTGTNVGPVALPGEYNACGAKFLGITSGTKIYPNTTGYQIELLNESNVVVAYYGR